MKFIFQGSQKKHVRVAISQKGLYEMSQDAPHFIAFWTPDWMALSEFTEVKVTLEVNCEPTYSFRTVVIGTNSRTKHYDTLIDGTWAFIQVTANKSNEQ